MVVGSYNSAVIVLKTNHKNKFCDSFVSHTCIDMLHAIALKLYVIKRYI